MKNQLRGIALIVFAVLIVVIGIAMTPDFSATFANIMPIIGGFVGFLVGFSESYNFAMSK